MEIQNILITGSGGFIGKSLKKYFETKYKILAPRSFELDLTDEKAVKNYFKNNAIDLIIHCASIGGERGKKDSETTLDNNLKMFANIANEKNADVKIITFGSGAMYDKARNLEKVKECEIGHFIPSDLYGKSKMELAKIIEKTDNVLCLNIFACYGIGEKETRFPSYAIIKNLKKEEIVIENNAVFDYLFIEDLEKIIEHFIINWTDEKIINATPAKSTTIKEIAEIINKISGYEAKIKVLNSTLGNEYTGDNSLLLKEIPDFCFTDLKFGLKKLFEHLKANQN